MSIRFSLNGSTREVDCRLGENAQSLLFNLGMHSVRNSDDGFGFAGSDSVLVNDTMLNASLLIAAQLDGASIQTSESLGAWNQLSIVQQSMIDTGVVQSGYNDPAAALIITDLLKRHPEPTREQCEDALSGLFSRDGGYQQMFEAIDLARLRMKNPQTAVSTVPEFRDDLVHVGKLHPKLDAAKMIQAKPSYVEDSIPQHGNDQDAALAASACVDHAP